jgi:quinol monooxygenase YgiN
MTTTLLFRCKVPDFDEWLPKYEEAVESVTEILGYKVWRNQDDSRAVTIMETYESRQIAEELLNSPEMKAEIAAHDVDMSSIEVAWLEEAASSG